MTQQRLTFADWLKAVGLALIVYGHVAAATTAAWTPPVYPKQIGVAFFVFVTGFTLARETRRAARVFYNRSFEMLLFGAIAAVVMSIVGLLRWSDPNQSNYLPLVGLHVLINDLPANPTTWYIGTYLHLLALWVVVLRRVRVRPWMLGIALAAEIVTRAFVVEEVGPFVAYMLVSNWLLVFLLGLGAGQRDASIPAATPASGVVLLTLLLWIGWPLAMTLPDWQLSFPFMSLASGASWPVAVLVSASVSFVYTTYTLSGWAVASRLPASSVAAFIARNSVIVFIAHMPVYYLLEYLLRPVMPSYAVRVTIEFAICLPGLVLCSEVIRAALKPADLRERVWARIEKRFARRSVLTSAGCETFESRR